MYTYISIVINLLDDCFLFLVMGDKSSIDGSRL